MRPATFGLGALGVLQLIAVLRYRDVPDWQAPQTWGYLAVLVGLAVLGLWGWRVARVGTAAPVGS